MATPAILTQGVQNTTGSLVTASVTPSGNYFIEGAVSMRVDGLPAEVGQLGVAANGLTWALVHDIVPFVGSERIHARFWALGASPTPGAITVTYGAGTPLDWAYHFWETQTDDTGDPFDGEVEGAQGLGTSLGLTITDTPDAGDLAIASIGTEDDTADLAQEGGWTQLGNIQTSNNCKQQVIYHTSAEQTPGWTWSNSKSASAIGLLVRAASGGLLAGTLRATPGRFVGAQMGFAPIDQFLYVSFRGL